MRAFLVVMGALVLGYLLLRANSLWIYRFFDRALSNARDTLPKSYEVPRYYTLKKTGEVDTSSRWPGWDGWYFFVVPDDQHLPFKMVRASLMTGLYGLEGIDSYEKLPPGLSAFDVVEYLTLTPQEEMAGGVRERTNHFSQLYLPKAQWLTMKPDELKVAVTDDKINAGAGVERYGSIRGAWPNYELQFINHATGIQIDLSYHGENLVWWADIPGIFTYFAAFGKFVGKIISKGAVTEEVYSLDGRGAFEHGFARKPWNFDTLWLPIRMLQKVIPSLRPVRYQYELLIGDVSFHGGFMHVRAFGIIWRNRGGLYVHGSYLEISNVELEYLNDPEPDLVNTRPGEPPVTFYRSWKVRAKTGERILEYVGLREWPPAPVASNMIYYHFSYEGTFKGERISGRGYGEYVHI